MIERVVFLIVAKFNQRDYHRFGFDIIQKRGYRVEVWDFVPFMNSPDYIKKYFSPDPFDFSGHNVYNTLDEAKSALATLSKTDVVFINAWGIYANNDLGKINGTNVGVFQLGLLPEVNYQPKIKDYLVKIISSPLHSIHAVGRKVLNRFNKLVLDYLITGGRAAESNNRYKILDYLITGGRAAESNNRYKINSNTVIIKAHAFDYDRYLEEEINGDVLPIKNNERFAVFLDEDMIFHTDILTHGKKPYCSEYAYYPEINSFFNEFEAQTGLKVVIAAHPKADYKKRGNPFDSCEINTGNTVSLVKHSQIVLGHSSTSMNFAVLYYKPIIFIDSNNYTQILRTHINNKASVLGLEKINISEEWSIDLNQIIVNKRKYFQYKEQYIKESGTPERYVWDIFCDYLDKLKQQPN